MSAYCNHGREPARCWQCLSTQVVQGHLRIASLESALVEICRDSIGVPGTFADRCRMHIRGVMPNEDANDNEAG